MDAIRFDIHGIKCDNKACGWEDNDAEFDMEKYHNMPCPKCSSNLFTDADYKSMKRLLKIAKWINFILRPFVRKNTPVKMAEVKMNGTGKIELGEAKDYERSDS